MFEFRIALVEPAAPGVHLFSGAALPRLGTVLLGTILRDLGYRVEVFVEEVQPIDEAALRSADLVGISTITPTAERSYRLADDLRKRGIRVVLGGPHVTWMAEEALEHADYVIRGEGEESLPALLEAVFSGGKPLENVPGLTWRGEDGSVRETPLAAPVDLDTLPCPDLGLLGFSGRALGPRRVVPVQTSRGCPYDCSFCTVHTTFGRAMRYRSVARVMDDLSRFDGADVHIFFYDDNFTVSRKRAMALTQAMIDGGFRGVWSAQTRADIGRDPELLDQMARSGCMAVYVGLESVNERALSSMRKKQNVAAMAENLRRIRAAKIDVHGMFVLGFDEDDPKALSDTVDFACSCGITSAQFLILTPLPGSETWRSLQQQGRIRTRGWGLYDAHHVVFAPTGVTPDELQQAQVQGHRRFYSLRRMLRHFRHGELRNVGVSLYARLVAWSWARKNRGYLEGLRELGMSDGAEGWESAFERVPLGRAGVSRILPIRLFPG
jgi:radical SAM superfamily enzyme YgiQ (UPF0313 family)